MQRFPKGYFFVATLVLTLISLRGQPAVAVDLEWDIIGPGDFFNAAFWNPVQAPTIVDDIFIRNDGEPEALAGGPLQANSISIGDAITGGNGRLHVQVDMQVTDNLLVAAHSDSEQVTANLLASGIFRMEAASLLEIAPGVLEHDFHVGKATVRAGLSADVGGTATIDNVTTVTLGGDVQIGAAVNEGGVTTVFGGADWRRISDLSIAGNMDVGLSSFRGRDANANGNVNANLQLNDITNVDIGSSFTLGRGTYEAGPTYPFRINADTAAYANPIEDIGTFNVGADIEIGTAHLDVQPGADWLVADTVADLVMHRIDSVNVGGDFHQARISGTDSHAAATFQGVDLDVSSFLSEIGSFSIAGDLNAGVIDLDASTDDLQTSSSYRAHTSIGVEYVRMTVDGTTSIGTLDGNANIAGADAFGRFPLFGSALYTNELRVGVKENPDVAGVAGGVLDLLPSAVDTELFVLGDGGVAEFSLWGLDRIDIDTVGTTLAAIENTYAAIDAADAVLSGTIIADFDFTPPSPGTYSFDLIQTDSLTALDDTSADLLIADLPAGFCVIFYGVAEEDGRDILRLTISTNCLPEPTTASLALLALGMLLPQRCRRMVRRP